LRCESCGYENDIDAQYCEKCGVYLSQKSSNKTFSDRSSDKKWMNNRTKVLIIACIVLVGILGVTVGVLIQMNNDPLINQSVNNQIDQNTASNSQKTQMTWHEVTTIKNPTKGTLSFDIQGEKCKLIISATPIVNYEENILVVDLFKDNVAVASPYVSWSATETPSSKEDTVVSSAGPGNYEMEIFPNNLEKWTIKVYDYY